MPDVKFIISVVRGFVVQGRDHAPDDLHVFFANFDWQVLKKTFGDTKIHSSSLLSSFLTRESLSKMVQAIQMGHQ